MRTSGDHLRADLKRMMILDGRNDQKRTELIAGTIESLEVDQEGVGAIRLA